MPIPGDAELEIDILRDRVTKLEDQLVKVHGALMETEIKVPVVMKRLLTANDVKGDKAMRINILEQMNDLRREIVGFFASAGIVIDPNERKH